MGEIPRIISTLEIAELPEDKYDELERLCEIISSAFGEDGAAIGQAIRKDGKDDGGA